MVVDFLERLVERVNQISGLPMQCEPGYLGVGESFVVYPLPGSNVTQEYMDGTTDQQLNFEFAVQSKIPGKINDTLWLVQNELEKLQELNSNDGSFDFQSIAITNKPFINQTDDQGWFVFLLDVQAKITVYREEK